MRPERVMGREGRVRRCRVFVERRIRRSAGDGGRRGGSGLAVGARYSLLQTTCYGFRLQSEVSLSLLVPYEAGEVAHRDLTSKTTKAKNNVTSDLYSVAGGAPSRGLEP
jgi:hypothetical protein